MWRLKHALLVQGLGTQDKSSIQVYKKTREKEALKPLAFFQVPCNFPSGGSSVFPVATRKQDSQPAWDGAREAGNYITGTLYEGVT